MIIFYIFSCLIFDVLHEVKFIYVWDIISRVNGFQFLYPLFLYTSEIIDSFRSHEVYSQPKCMLRMIV